MIASDWRDFFLNGSGFLAKRTSSNWFNRTEKGSHVHIRHRCYYCCCYLFHKLGFESLLKSRLTTKLNVFHENSDNKGVCLLICLFFHFSGCLSLTTINSHKNLAVLSSTTHSLQPTPRTTCFSVLQFYTTSVTIMEGARNSLDSVLIWPYLGTVLALRAVVKRSSRSLAKSAHYWANPPPPSQ